MLNLTIDTQQQVIAHKLGFVAVTPREPISTLREHLDSAKQTGWRVAAVALFSGQKRRVLLNGGPGSSEYKKFIESLLPGKGLRVYARHPGETWRVTTCSTH